MGEVIAAFGLSHAPGITAFPKAAPPEDLEAVHQAFAEIRQRIEALRPDAIVIITPEHWVNFFLNNMPAFCVGTAEDYAGPAEDWLGVPKTRVPGHPALARDIVEDAMDAGIEPAFSEELVLDHGTMLPLHFLTPAMNVPVVPIVQNCLQPPMPRAFRCYQLGQSIARTIERRSERVVVIGSGGLSHWPGELQHGQINRAWDERILELMRQGKGEELSRYSEAQIAEGGTGGFEMRNWVTMLGAAGNRPAEVIAYRPVPAFATGLAFAAL
jgi:AmmeMemoRadiSam system protein B